MRVPPGLAVVVALAAAASPARAAASLADFELGDCPPVCATTCVKPIVVPDRWDDVTPLPGHEAWARNGRYDSEAFTDQSDNDLYDVGEPFEDGNANGRWDAEAYHPVFTGYVPDPVPGNFLAGPNGDLGRLIALRPSKEARAVASNYYAVNFPPANKGTPERGARAFRAALESCVSYFIEKGDRVELEPGSMTGPTYDALRAMYEQDPEARWDEATRTIVGSAYPAGGRRVVLIGLSDPRVVPRTGRATLVLSKIAAFFFEAPSSDGSVSGRFLKVRAPGAPCGCTCDPAEAFLRNCP